MLKNLYLHLTRRSYNSIMDVDQRACSALLKDTSNAKAQGPCVLKLPIPDVPGLFAFKPGCNGLIPSPVTDINANPVCGRPILKESLHAGDG